MDWSTTKVRHGTHSGWSLHVKLEERPCDPCFQAKSEYDARRRSATPHQLANRRNAKAQAQAHARLRHEFPELYRQYYNEAKKDIQQEE